MPNLFKPDVEKLEAKQDIRSLVEALRYKRDPEVQTRATDALIRIGEIAVESIIHILKKDIEIQTVAASILKKIGGSKANEALSAYQGVPNLIKQVLELEHGKVLVGSSIDRWFAAVDKLGEIGDVRAVEPLSRLLKCTVGGARVRVAAALEKIDDKNTQHYGKIARSEIDQIMQEFRLK